MLFKHVLVFCAQALLIQLASSQCINRGIAGPLGPNLALGGCAASTGGGFAVTSASPIAPIGVSIVSENAIEGALVVEGSLPLLGSVGLEGAFTSGGAGAVSYGCGDGAIGIGSEGPIATGILTPGPIGPAIAPGVAYGAGELGCNGRAGACGIY